MSGTPDLADFAVLGTGPAGCVAAAVLAEAGASVVLVATGRGVDRVEALSPGVPSLCRRLGIPEAVFAPELRPLPATSIRWECDAPRRFDHVFAPEGPPFGARRASFDRILLDRAEACGVRLIQPRRTAGWQHRPDGTFLVECVPRVEARTLIVATGAVSRRLLAGPSAACDDRLLALTTTIEVPPGDEMPAELVIEAVSDGWWYAVPAPGRSVGLGLVTDPESQRRSGSDALLHRAAHESRCLAPFRRQAASWQAAPIPLRRASLAPASRVFRLGDALATCDPLAGRGVFEAMRTAEEIALRLASGKDDPALPEEALAARHAVYWRARDHLYRAAHARLGTPFWQRRIGRSDAARPALPCDVATAAGAGHVRVIGLG